MYIDKCNNPSCFSTHQWRCQAPNFLISLTLCSDLQFQKIQISSLSRIPLGSGKRHKGCKHSQIVESLGLIWVSFWMERFWQSYIGSGRSLRKRLQGRLRSNHQPPKVRNLHQFASPVTVASSEDSFMSIEDLNTTDVESDSSIELCTIVSTPAPGTCMPSDPLPHHHLFNGVHITRQVPSAPLPCLPTRVDIWVRGVSRATRQGARCLNMASGRS